MMMVMRTIQTAIIIFKQSVVYWWEIWNHKRDLGSAHADAETFRRLKLHKQWSTAVAERATIAIKIIQLIQDATTVKI